MELETYLAERFKASTAASYKREIEAYLQNQPKAVTAKYKDIVAYLGALRTRYHKPKTMQRIVAAIKSYYDYLQKSHQRRDNPAQSIHLRDKASKDIQLQDMFTTEELESLLERKERYEILATRNKVLTTLLIYQGLTVEELAQLKTTDINLQEATIKIRATSRTNTRTLSLKPNQIMLLHNYLHETRPKLLRAQDLRQKTTLLIGSRGEEMQKEEIGKHIARSFKGRFAGRRVIAQTIRQSVITNLLKAGNDVRIVQEFAGHKYPSSTEKYKQTHLEELKTGVLKYHPFR